MNYVANPMGELPPIISSISETSGAVQRTYTSSSTCQRNVPAARLVRIRRLNRGRASG
jgi:hypothetical protein